jgi:predicted 3-demethylubiquinone-9 3-methyltransferase (glyoxalase superfamily)
MPTIQKIKPYLWFDNQAAEAAQFYTSMFEDSQIISTSPMMVEFQLAGQQFMALNGGPQFKFNESVSFFITCDDQAEVDFFWESLIADGGSGGRCGWLKDKYGLSWQVIPKQLAELMSDKNREKANRVMQAMMQMNKIVVADLEAAYQN